jgi:hypothetical protein
MLFVIGAPRSGTTMLEHMLSAHSRIQGGPEPHLLTPLAHLGIWAKVDKAPYDHILAAQAQKEFVAQLPHKEQDYWEACRAYCNVLYGRYMEGKDKDVCLDKTPAYALILPFLMKVYPDAKYIVLTRHPLALFSSYANSFFDGDYAHAHNFNPILLRYVPALAAFLRQREVAHIHVRYEDLVKDPETWFERICTYIGIPYEPEAIEYGKSEQQEARPKGLGDPLGVDQHTRPTTRSVKKWAQELAADPAKLGLMQGVIAQLDPADLETIGYPADKLWEPLKEIDGTPAPLEKPGLNRYRLQRKAIMRGRAFAQRTPAVRRMIEKARLACDVLLRE